MATSQVVNGTQTLAQQLAALGLTAEDLAKTVAEKSGGTRVEVGKPADPVQSEIERLKAENAALRAKAAKSTTAGTLTPHVSEKGALSVYGLGRFPVTLYSEQWERLLGYSAEIKAFIAKHEHVAEVRAVDGVQVSRKLTRQ